MAYALHRLASGSYDLELDGELIGNVVRIPGRPPTWAAELLSELTPEKRPCPFDHLEYTFQTFQEVLEWLGGAVVKRAGALAFKE